MSAVQLQRIMIVNSTQLTLYFLRWNGRCAAEEEVNNIVEADPDQARDLIGVLAYIAEHGFRTPDIWFRKLHELEDGWEIRKWGRFRIYGFVVADSELYLCECENKRGRNPDGRLLKRVARLRDAWLMSRQ